ncbi:serine/threonine protein kinase [Akanthomyces lecanii RCEF 1005]|uniref:Serine/threonine protein kinase n=1 Tax=Akanthomyces lecanii RCEF 1005 TaxID=1081108 RepID=A0A162KHQ0_CORDF|nr:serine/threonine protein kinase [Akanthomyces lecanii RCEF 1005]
MKNCVEVKMDKRGNSEATLSSMKFVGNSQVKQLGDKVSSTIRSLTSEKIRKTVFRQDPIHSTVINALENKQSSEALARRLWFSFVREGKTLITSHDLVETLGATNHKHALEAFEMFDQDVNANISLEDMVHKTVDIGEERRAIFGGIRNIGDTVKAFDKVLLVVVAILTVFIFVAFFKQNVITVLAAASAAILSLSFAFSATAQEFLGSCIFLFVKHPYDVGDRVDVNRSWAVIEPLVVEEISLLYTVFRGIDTMKIVQAPNIQLNDVWIDNFSRSGAMVEKIAVDVSFDTTAEDIELLREEMETFVNAPENCRDFQSDFNITCGGVGNLDKLTLHATIKHKSNWHNEAIRTQRRSKFMTTFAGALRKIPIYPPGGGFEPLGGHSNPTYTVAVTDKFASQSRRKAAEAKVAARFDQARRMSNSYTSGSDGRRDTEHTLGGHASILELRRRSGEIIDAQTRQAEPFSAFPSDEASSSATISRAASIPVSPMGSNYDIEAQLGTNPRDLERHYY